MTKIVQIPKTLDLTGLDALNARFTTLTYQERIRELYRLFSVEQVLYTSSFGTKSAFLLHQMSLIQPAQKVHFVNTGFHFQETLNYRDQLAEQFGMEVIDVLPDPEQHERTRKFRSWVTDIDDCCRINKVAPLEPIKARHKVWISGLMSWQTDFRAGLRVFEYQDGILKFHPLIDIDEGEFLYHMAYYKLPRHPLEASGYGSIGCTHCTKKGQGRSGRWENSGKTECGLHPGYFLKQN